MYRKTGLLLFFWCFNLVILPACVAQQAVLPINTSALALTETQTSPISTSPATPPAPVPLPATPASPPVCNSKTGKLESGEIDTTMLAKPMRYTVYLPPCYGFDTNLRYPVLYLLHGQGFTEDQWIRIGAASAADRLISNGETPPFLIVLPFDHSYKQPNQYNFEDVFIQRLMPLIDQNYRTNPVASQRAIGGLSRGGAWALHIGARHPGLFGAIGGHSPAIFYSDQQSLPRNLLAIRPDQMPRIWLDAGDSDSEYDVVLPFEKFLVLKNIPHEWHRYLGWHDEKYWSAHVDKYLRWYALGW